jgi:hypothetical protein
MACSSLVVVVVAAVPVVTWNKVEVVVAAVAVADGDAIDSDPWK